MRKIPKLTRAAFRHVITFAGLSSYFTDCVMHLIDSLSLAFRNLQLGLSPDHEAARPGSTGSPSRFDHSRLTRPRRYSEPTASTT